MELIYYFLLPEKFPEHLSIKLMFKLFPAYFFPNLRNAAKFSTEDLKHLIKIPGLDVAGAYQLFFSRFKKLPILDNCYLFELYRTITNFKPLPVLQKVTLKTVLPSGFCASQIVSLWWHRQTLQTSREYLYYITF